MVQLKEQVNSLRRRRLQRLANRPLWPEKEHLDYLRRFFRSQSRLLYLSLSCLFLQALLEIALILVSHRYLKNFSDLVAAVNFWLLLFLISLLALLYLFFSFTAVKGERTLIVRLINDLRDRWFRLFLNKREEEGKLEDKSGLIAKVSYHLPLLSTGLANSLAGTIRWLLFVAILLFLAFAFGYKLLIFSAFAIVFSFLVLAASFWISYRYVTKETTFYSQIIRLMDFNLSDWQFIKKFKRERAVIKDFAALVELDSYFRVRRDLWLRFSASVIFVLLIFFAFFAGTWSDNLEYFFGSASLDTRFIMIVSLVYFSRLLYESLRTGLYAVPFLLGLKLSVPRYRPRRLGKNYPCRANLLVFQAQKTKLSKTFKRYRSFKFEFERGGRYLLIGSSGSGRSALAKLFTGNSMYGRRAWIVKDGRRRYFYNEFFDKYSGFYYLDPYFKSYRSLLETVCGKEKAEISAGDLAAASDLLNRHPELRQIFSEREDWRFRADKFAHSAKNILLLQVIYCLLNPPRLIAVDNAWLDSRDDAIISLLRLLDRLLPQSSLVFFARQDERLFTYTRQYEI